MSNFGGAFLGDSSNILISDFTKALAFIGTGVSHTESRLYIAHPDIFGFSGYRTIQNFIAVEEPFPYEYQIDSGSVEIPLVFFEPSVRCAVTRVYKLGNTYWATVMSDSSIKPKVYFFAPRSYAGSETNGMKVVNANGDIMFDSRNLNLAIKNIVTVSSPTISNTGSVIGSWSAGSPDSSQSLYFWVRDGIQLVKASGSVTKTIDTSTIERPIVCINSTSTANLSASARRTGTYFERFDGVNYTRDYYATGTDYFKNGNYWYSDGILDPYPDRNSYGFNYRRNTQYPNTTRKDWYYQFKDWCNYRIGCAYTTGNYSELTFSWIMNQAGCYYKTGGAGYYEAIKPTGSGGNPPYERYGVQNAGDFSVLIADGANYD